MAEPLLIYRHHDFIVLFYLGEAQSGLGSETDGFGTSARFRVRDSQPCVRENASAPGAAESVRCARPLREELQSRRSDWETLEGQHDTGDRGARAWRHAAVGVQEVLSRHHAG